MDNKLFTEESRKAFANPERGADYNRTASPRIWILLIGISVFLTGFIIWGLFGRINVFVKVIGAVEDGVLYVYAYDNSKSVKLELADRVRIDGEDYLITSAELQKPEDSSQAAMVYLKSLYCDLEEGIYEGYAILNTCSPFEMAFSKVPWLNEN